MARGNHKNSRMPSRAFRSGFVFPGAISLTMSPAPTTPDSMMDGLSHRPRADLHSRRTVRGHVAPGALPHPPSPSGQTKDVKKKRGVARADVSKHVCETNEHTRQTPTMLNPANSTRQAVPVSTGRATPMVIMHLTTRGEYRTNLHGGCLPLRRPRSVSPVVAARSVAVVLGSPVGKASPAALCLWLSPAVLAENITATPTSILPSTGVPVVVAVTAGASFVPGVSAEDVRALAAVVITSHTPAGACARAVAAAMPRVTMSSALAAAAMSIARAASQLILGGIIGSPLPGRVGASAAAAAAGALAGSRARARARRPAVDDGPARLFTPRSAIKRHAIGFGTTTRPPLLLSR